MKGPLGLWLTEDLAPGGIVPGEGEDPPHTGYRCHGIVYPCDVEHIGNVGHSASRLADPFGHASIQEQFGRRQLLRPEFILQPDHLDPIQRAVLISNL